jgi:hypothetical protein
MRTYSYKKQKSKQKSSKSHSKSHKKSHRKVIKYNNTYFLDSCFVVNAKKKWIFTDRLVYHLNRIGLKEDYMMNKIIDLDTKYLKKHNILFDNDKCLADYKIPQNFNTNLLKPLIVFIRTSAIDPRIRNINTKLCNLLYYPHFNSIYLKNELYFNMKEKFPEITKKHMANTFMINDIKKYEFPKHYILRPVYENMNNKFFRNIFFINFISNKKELDDAIEFYDKYNHGYNVIASEYIMNPLLFRGKKCHIRMFNIVSVINDKICSFLFNKGEIFTAEESYDSETIPFSREVHISTFGGTRRDFLFPDEFNDDNLNVKGLDPNDIYRQMKMLLACVDKLINPKGKKLLDNHENGFNIGHVEFLVDDNGIVYLLEVNKPTGMIFNNRDICEMFIDKAFDWICTSVVEPCLKGMDPSKHPAYIDPNTVV